MKSNTMAFCRRTEHADAPLIPDIALFQRKLATLPLTSHQAGETVLSAASTTGRLLILKEGAVAVVKEGIEIARVTEPGAVFGEFSVLLSQPHTAARADDHPRVLCAERRHASRGYAGDAGAPADCSAAGPGSIGSGARTGSQQETIIIR
jgi:CRP-like cAMP-binding protein